MIGVDDNAPYAVYHDVAALDVGAELRYRAIVSDVAGNLNAAGTTAVVGEEEPPATGDAKYAVVHYQRADGDYGDQSSDDFNDFWGLHAWGDIVPVVEWTDPIRFIGEDDYGRFAWVELQPGAQNMGLIVHRGDTKDGTTEDRFIDPSRTPEVWLKSGDATIYTSQAAADGFATIRYHRDDGDLRRLGPAPVGRRHRPGRRHRVDGTAPVRRHRRVRRVLAGAARRTWTCRSTSSSTTATRRTPARTSRSSRRSSRRRGSCPATRRSTAAAARRRTWRRSTTTARPATTATRRHRTSADFWGLHVWAGAAPQDPP